MIGIYTRIYLALSYQWNFKRQNLKNGLIFGVNLSSKNDLIPGINFSKMHFFQALFLDFQIQQLAILKPVEVGKSYIPQKKAL